MTISASIKQVLPLFKEAVARCQTELGILSRGTEDARATIEREMAHLMARMDGNAERDDSMLLAELINDCLNLMKGLDDRWHMDEYRLIMIEEGGVTVSFSGRVLDHNAAVGRAYLHALKTVLRVDRGGHTSQTLILELLPAAIVAHQTYAQEIVSHLELLPF